MTISEKIAKIKENEEKIYYGAYNEGFVKGGNGIDTSDANATAGTILSGYNAYVDGKKIEGTITTQPAAYVSTRDGYLYVPAGYYPDDSRIIEANLVPENIKKDTSIFGIVGTYEGSVNEASLHEALNNLLTVQESYMPEISTFFFVDIGNHSHELEFEVGMTWGEWCTRKEYNTLDLYISEENGYLYCGVTTVWDEATLSYVVDDTPIVSRRYYIVR